VRPEPGPRIRFGPGFLRALSRLRREAAAAGASDARRVFTRAWRYASTAGEAAASGRRAAEALDGLLRGDPGASHARGRSGEGGAPGGP